MSDNLTPNYLDTRGDRAAVERKALDDRLAKLMATPEQAAAPGAPTAATPADANIPVDDTKSAGWFKEGRNAVVGGVRDATQNTLDMFEQLGGWIDENYWKAREAAGTGGSTASGLYGSLSIGSKLARNAMGAKDDKALIQLPTVEANKTVGGQVGRSLTQFIVPFLSASKAMTTAGWTTTTTKGMMAKGMVAGAATDFSAFDPHEKRLSNIILEMSDNDPLFGKSVMEYLAADPSDTTMEGRLKNTIEGAGLGIAAEGVFLGIRGLRGVWVAKGKKPAEELTKAADGAAGEAIDETAPAVQAGNTPMQDQINAATGVREPGPERWQKRLDVANAVKEADAKAAAKAAEDAKPKVKPDIHKAADEAGVEIQTPSRPLTAAERNDAVIRATMEAHEKAIAGGAAPHRVLLEADGSVTLSRGAPAAGQIDLDAAVTAALRPGTAKAAQKAATPGDTAATAVATTGKDTEAAVKAELHKHLQAYKQLQEAAMGDIKATVNKAAKGSAKSETPKTTEVSKFEEGDSVLFDGGRGSGEFVKHSKDGKVVIKDDATGKARVVTPDAEDALVAEVKANDKKIKSKMGNKQSGHVSAQLLAQMAGAQAGATVGWMSADDDATLADKLSLAGLGALAGLKIGRVGAEKIATREAAQAAAEKIKQVEGIAHPLVRNVAPKAALGKKPPTVTQAKVDQLIQLAKSGKPEDVLQAAKGTDFNFDHIDTPDDVKAMVNGFSSVFEKELDKAKHGVQTNKMMADLADELGAGEASLKNLYQDTDNLGARILAHRALLTASAEKVTGMAKLLTNPELRPAGFDESQAVLSMRKHVALHASIQAQMKGVQAEVARALAQFRIQSSSLDLSINERNMLIEAMGGHKANMEFAQKLAAVSDPKKIAAITRKGAMARTQDALYEAWVNGLLSSPVTHAVNMMGNSLVAIGSAAERYSAAMIGKVLRTGGEAVQVAEANAHLFGMAEGLLDAVKITSHGLKAMKDAAGATLRGDVKGADTIIRENADEFGGAWQAFANDMPVLDNAGSGTKDIDSMSTAISADRMVPTSGMASDVIDNLDIRKQMEVFADVLGSVVRTPGRFLTTGDELFKTIHYRGELKAQAYRTARGAGLEGDDFVREVARLIEDPTPELRAQALTAAREGTFTSPLGKSGQPLQRFVQNTPGARYIVPFVRTPVNIMKYVGVRTPVLNTVAESVRNEFKAGGVRRDMMLAKTATGGMLYALGAYLASQGLIVGGGEKDKQSEKLGGIQPYSIKVGDKYYGFNRMDPLGIFLGLSADISEISGQVDDATMGDLTSASVMAISRNLVSKSYLSGVINLLEAVTDPDRYGDQFVKGFASSFVPMSALSGTIRRETDPLMREAWSVTDAIKNKLPGYSDELPPKVNIFGEDMKFTGGMGPDWVSPIRTSDATSDIAASEIARLNVDLREPPKRIGGGNGTPAFDLTQKQYYKLMKNLGEGFKPAISELVQSKFYQDLPEDPSGSTYVEAKEMVIRKLYEAHKQAAVARLIQEDAELYHTFVQNKENAGKALLGLPVTPIRNK